MGHGHVSRTTRVPLVFVCVCWCSFWLQRDSVITKSNPVLPRRNQWIRNDLCASRCVCACLQVYLLELPKNMRLFLHALFCVCFCLCALVRRGLNTAKSSNCNRNKILKIVASLIAVWQFLNSLYFIFCLRVFYPSAQVSRVITYWNAFDLPICTGASWVRS